MNQSPSSRLNWALLILIGAFVQFAPAQWLAFNDHAEGAGTHPHATRYHITGAGDGTNGPLKNILNGDALPVTLTISRSGIVLAEATADNPALDTPLADTFKGYVDFTGTPAPNLGMSFNGRVTYTLEGLDPAKRYLLYAGAVRGGDASLSNRWTLSELVGADFFVNEHSAGVLTSAQVPQLTAQQAAMNTGINNTADTGDMVGWVDIDPGADGIIQIVCAKYSGSVPGGSSSGTVGYALTGLSLREYIFDAAPSIQQQPTNQIVEAGQPATFSVVAEGRTDIIQWFRNGDPIPGATRSTYVLPVALPTDSGSRFSVSLSNQFGAVTSEEAILIVHSPSWAPLLFDHEWRYDNSGSDLGTSWRETQYDDSTWREGPGLFGFESDSLPQPIRTPLTNSNQRTYYFRTTFVVTNSPGEHHLHLSQIIDDGAIVYLNGEELFRVRMPAGPVNADTLADETVGNAALELVELPNVSLNLGTNWLAVEVHQASSGSSDLVFGLSIDADPVNPTPLTITDQPSDADVHQFQPATFTVGVEGNLVDYQWFKDDAPILDANQATILIPRTDFSDAGSYSVTVSNAWGVRQSESASLTVGDAVPIQILSQPTDQSALINEPIVLAVEVGGDTPYHVQWFRNGHPLPGATSPTLILNQPHWPDAGIYSYWVSNNFSGAIGDAFTLDVMRHPRGEPGSLHGDFVGEADSNSILLRGMTRLKDGRLLVGASFQSRNGIAQRNLTRLSQDGLVDESFQPDVNGSPWIIHEEPDGSLLIGGSFTRINGVARTNLARLFPDGSLDLDFEPRPSVPSYVRDIAVQADGKIIAVGGSSNSEIFRFRPDGTLEFFDINQDAVANGGAFYYAVAIQPDGKILLGGRLVRYHDQNFAGLIRLHPDGRLDESFLAGTNAPTGWVHDIQVHQNKIYISGTFESVAGVERSGIARLNMDGTIDPHFIPPKLDSTTISPSVIYFVVQPSQRVLIAGFFQSADGIPMGSVARLHSNGSLDTSFQVNPGANERIYRVAINLSSDIYVAGYFTEFNGEPRRSIAKIYGTGEPILDYQRTPTGALQLLWPGDREDLVLESAEAVSGQPWTLVTETTNTIQYLNATIIQPAPPARVFRVRTSASE